MGYKRGNIYLADFNARRGTEPGKIRPCLVMQANLLNDEDHPSTTVIPLTAQLLDDAAPLRFRIKARDQLERDSDLIMDQTRSIDNERFISGKLTALTKRELLMVEEYWKIVLGLNED